MDYKQLQQKAKKLGLKYGGASKVDLERSIKEAEAKDAVVAVNPPKAQPSKVLGDATSPVKASAQEEKANTAIVYNANREVRRFTRLQHGEEFKTLAVGYAQRNNYEVKFKDVGKGIICPSCGHEFDPKD